MPTPSKQQSFGSTNSSSLLSARSFSPRVHQEFIEDHLDENPVAGIFAGCGLGKTAACLHQISKLLLDGACRGVLVLAPLRVANLTWPMEPLVWEQFSWIKVANLRTKEGWKMLMEGSAHIYVCNYEFTPKLIANYLKGRRVKQWAFDTCILDEITVWKNPESVRAKAFSPYLHRMKRRWGLTGTPASNGLQDLFGILKCLDGGERLGKSQKGFKERYFYTVGAKPGAPTHQGRPVAHSWAKEAINRKIVDICLTLRREDYLHIPDVVEEEVDVKLPPKAQEQYDELEQELLLHLEEWGKDIDIANAAVLMGKLLQVTGGAIYHTDEETMKREWFPLHDAKIEALRKTIKKQEGPVIVLCNFHHEQERIRKAFPEAKFVNDFKGEKGHSEMERAWNAREIEILVSHPKSVGHGLNLQAGGNVLIWFTLNWSRELYDQTLARLARQGQEVITKIIRLMAPGSVDWAVAESLRMKGDGQNELLEALSALQKQAKN